jgi:hypothetical protein
MLFYALQHRRTATFRDAALCAEGVRHNLFLTSNLKLITFDHIMAIFKVSVKKKVLKEAGKMPDSVQEKLAALLEDLQEKGPVQPDWPNYSKIGKEIYHCHLARKWAACWYCEDKSLIIEVYYAGSRENAPY